MRIMELLANQWWVTLIVAFVCWIIAAVFQVRYIVGLGKSLGKTIDNLDAENIEDVQIGKHMGNFVWRMYGPLIPVFIFALVGAFSMILAIIGVVAKLVG